MVTVQIHRSDLIACLERFVVVVVALALAAVTTAPRAFAESSDTAFEFSGDCVVGIFFVPGDGAAVQSHLPPGYTVLTDPITGKATLIVEAGSCSNVTIDRTPASPYFFGEILTFVGPPGDPAGTVYDFGAPTSSPRLAKRFDALGLRSLHLLTKDMTVEVRPDSIEAHVPWRFSPYSFSIELAGSPLGQPDPNDRCCAWTEGSRGTVGGRFCLSHDGEPGEVDTAGSGTLVPEPGTPLARMMGNQAFTGPAFRREFHFEADVALFASRADERQRPTSPSACSS